MGSLMMEGENMGEVQDQGQDLGEKEIDLVWPATKLPLELFSLIASRLPRSTIQNMRLVNKEFEEKVSEYLFRAVVVPFKPAIYGISKTLNGAGDIVLQDVGMRVFQGYGGRILKFAMSFDFDEVQLYCPPAKSEQEAITSFWGLYRWPFKNYHRFSRLEDMEQTADETKTMAKALRFIVNATELGLSIDGGLGWLAGPDTNTLYRARSQRLPVVFGESRFPDEVNPQRSRASYADAEARFSTYGKSALYIAFERMLHEAGYRGETLESSIRMMLEGEQTNTPDPVIAVGSSNTIGQDGSGTAATTRPSSSSSGSSSPPDPMAVILNPRNYNGMEIRAALMRIRLESNAFYPLKPALLTSGQKEMLLETEWAQRAFMQSYAIAIIDNPVTFQNVEVLTIARLPSRHVPILRRADFWDSLAQLRKLSLAVIPDWRTVAKMPTSFVQDQIIHPSLAITPVYQLLKEQISSRRNIKELHFEWLCGGEFAPGLFSRNKNILAAPLVATAMEMLKGQKVKAMKLPYLERLSLKNCWISPHIMKLFSVGLKKASLQYLTLESVSLTATVSPTATLTPLNGAAAQNAYVAAQPQVQDHIDAAANAVPGHLLWPQYVQFAPAPPTFAPFPPGPKWYEKPRVGSWADYVDHMTPGVTLADIRHARFDGPATDHRDRGKIVRIEFLTCGYVRIPLNFDQRAVDSHDLDSLAQEALNRMEDILCLMVSSEDHCLGVTTGFMDPLEKSTLVNAWGMQYGWGTRRQQEDLEAKADGVRYPGSGRFDGSV